VGETAIVVLVPEAESLVGAWRRVHTDDGRHGMPPHVTLIYPFVDDSALPRQVAGVGTVVGCFQAFDCAFAETARFDGVLYLSPAQDEIFRAMTDALARAFPDKPPYGGRYDDVVPHLTVAESGDDALLASIERDVHARLPIATHVAAASLMHFVDGRWREHTSVALA